MGKEANTLKDRMCKHCKKQFYMKSVELQEHAVMCERATRSGLILPGAVERSTLIRSGKGYEITKLD